MLAWPRCPGRLPIGLASSTLPTSRSASVAEPLLDHAADDAIAADLEHGALLAHAALAKQASATAPAAEGAGREGVAAPEWVSTLPATAACTLALFVQKAVQQVGSLCMDALSRSRQAFAVLQPACGSHAHAPQQLPPRLLCFAR